MKKLYMIMIIIFSIMIYTDVYAVRYSNAQITGGTSLGNGMQRIMVNAQQSPPDYLVVYLPNSLARGEEVEFNIPMAITFSGTSGRIPSFYGLYVYGGVIHTCSMDGFYAQTVDTSSNFVSTNMNCKLQIDTTDSNPYQIAISLQNPFSNGQIGYWFVNHTTLIFPNLDESGGGSSQIDYTSYIDDIETILNTMDTNGDNRYNGIIAYLRTMNTNRENEYQNIISALNSLVSGNTSITNAINNQTQQQQQQNQIINNTDTSGNASSFGSDVNNFTIPNTSHGFDILGSLQNFVSGLSVSGSCNRISVPIPFTNQTLVLPCMTTDVYSVHFPEIVIIWQLLVRGIAYYYILVNILRLIKETIDPFNFKLEVMDL